MRLAIFSDVHGNLEALENFLEALKDERVDRLVCLGDTIGYGPNPNECLEMIKSISKIIVLMGNHEWAALNPKEAQWSMNSVAYKAIEWTRFRLTMANFDYISYLPISAELDSFCFFHASAYFLGRWDYIRPGDRATVRLCLDHSTQRITCVGHTHQPALLDANADEVLPSNLFSDGTTYKESGNSKLIINPGSIGQPRDRSHLPCYVIYDSEARCITWRRLPGYNPHITAQKILESGLPAELAYYLES